MFWLVITDICLVVSDAICPAFMPANWSSFNDAISEAVRAEITLLDKAPICCPERAVNRRVLRTLTCALFNEAICAVVNPRACAAERAAT